MPVGAHAVLVEVPDPAAARSLAAFARAAGVEAVEVVPAARTVLFDGVTSPSLLAEQLVGWSPSGDDVAGAVVEVPVSYDGDDLSFLAERWGTEEDAVVERHTSLTFVAEFCGFAPGFSYLSGLPGELAVPRLDSPRSRVPAGAVALAGTWCGVYPTASPGGWRILGTTDVVLWDPDRDHPALLAPGTRVRFVRA